MRVFVGCEFSGIVRDAFRDRGHLAISADLVATIKPGLHIQGDIRSIPDLDWEQFDLGIFHPDCTYLCSSGARWLRNNPERQAKRDQAIEFVRWIYNLPIKRIAIENPIGALSTVFRKPDQIIQPWQFGHGETKATCLWLKGLPELNPTNIVDGRIPRIHYESPSIKEGLTRSQRRSITYSGIANAMAEQWGGE